MLKNCSRSLGEKHDSMASLAAKRMGAIASWAAAPSAVRLMICLRRSVLDGRVVTRPSSPRFCTTRVILAASSATIRDNSRLVKGPRQASCRITRQSRARITLPSGSAKSAGRAILDDSRWARYGRNRSRAMMLRGCTPGGKRRFLVNIRIGLPLETIAAVFMHDVAAVSMQMQRSAVQ